MQEAMRVLITGASGNLGKAMTTRLKAANHELVLSDLHQPPEIEAVSDFPFMPADVQIGVGLERTAEGCDLILHLPAWHGIHRQARTEIDFWRLNVDGTFWMFQAALAAGIKRVVFLSSQSWHGHYDKYGFTKRVGEELCEYYRRNHGIRFVAMRPADFTPSPTFLAHGVRLLYGGVDRDDVLDATMASIEHLSAEPDGEPEGIVVNAVRANAFTAEQLEGWNADPAGTCGRIFGGSARELIERYDLDIARRPSLVDIGDGASAIGYAPSRHFGTFLEELWLLDESLGHPAVRALPGPC